MQDLANSLESALKYRVSQGNFEVSIFTGQGDYSKVNPSLVIHAEGGPESPLGSGNFNVNVNCELRMTAETQSLPVFRQLARDVLGMLMADDLATQLSAEATDLCVFGIFDRQFRQSTDENQWLSALMFTCYCCRTDVEVET